MRLSRLAALALFAPLLCIAAPPPKVQSFPLTDTNDLVLKGLKADIVEYKGRKAVLLTKDPQDQGAFAFLKGVDFQDGTIEADFACKTTVPPGVRMPGFIGIAFRARADASHYELFYMRPGNSHAEEQPMRNHSVQYSSTPGFEWYQLRREWPETYEAHAELTSETWTKVKIEVSDRQAKLFLNGDPSPTLIVDGLKGEDLHGGIALWGYANQESYFSNLRITPAPAAPIQNGADAAGMWDVTYASDYGRYTESLSLKREAARVIGVWSGSFGANLPVTGTWREGYLDLTFNGAWPEGTPYQPGGPVPIKLAGWIDGDTAKGRMRVEGRADGHWNAVRKRTN
jgi:hypothetical protein